ncbi:MAG: HK97 family phage prohead protease [Elusimicrobiota bacterium]
MDIKGINFQYNFDITKTYEEEGNWIVEGLCATSDLDLQGDIITQRALELSAKDLEEYSTVLHNHNEDEAIGKVIRSESVEDGLWLKVFISKTVPDIWQKIKEGVLNKFSIRGKVLEAKKTWIEKLQKFVKFILRMKLVEASIVAVPANAKARTLRWYIEKALDEFEKNGGELETMNEKELEELANKNQTDQVDSPSPYIQELGSQEEKQDGNVPEDEEELIEAVDEPDLENTDETKVESTKVDKQENKKSSAESEEIKGFPAPEKLWQEWSEYCKGKSASGTTANELVWDVWVEFCKYKGYPYPYPYPYARPFVPQARLRELISLLDEWIEDEEDPDTKTMLEEIRSILRNLTGERYPYPYPYPYPKPSNRTTKSENLSEEKIEKIGRKISAKRLAELKKLAETLQSLIAELTGETKTNQAEKQEVIKKDELKSETKDEPKEDSSKVSKDIEEKFVNTFENLTKNLLKRIENLENVAGKSQVIKGQEDEEGEAEKGSVWKGVIRPLYEK